MNPGEFNKIVIIQKIETKKALKDEELKDFRRMYARVKNNHGNETQEADTTKSKITKVITIRYIKELDTSYDFGACQKYKVKYKNQIYNILSIENIKEESIYLKLTIRNE